MNGEDVNRAGVVTIENVSFVTDGQSGATDKSKGAEYDFAASEDNEKNDYKDPGKAPVDGYTLIWADEFDGKYDGANVDAQTGLNLDNWAYQLGDGTTDCGNAGWGNNELEAYTDQKKNIAVNEDLSGDGNPDGLLRITASYEEEGYKYGTESTKKYTSGRIRSTKPDGELFNTTYGYIEARMSLPATQGAWPAFWMLPQSTDIYDGWPISGELDIMETVGSFGNEVHDQTCSTLHYGAPDHVYRGSGYTKLSSDYTYFHTYGVDWKPGEITWYYDGQPIHTMNNWESGYSGASDKLSFDAPYDQPFYMLLNLAVDSGQFGGSANKAAFEDDINMYVDYVRVYQKEDGYAEYVDQKADDGAKTDWADYAGQNQITAITEGNIEDTMGEDKASDKSKWYVSSNANVTGGAATASTVTEDGKTWAKLDITEAGSQDYSVQLIGHYDAKAGYVYQVSFNAYAEGGMIGKTVKCDSKEWQGWSTYGIQSFELKDTATPVEYIINQTVDFDNCRIEFNLGSVGTGTVYISDVKVEIIDPASIGGESSTRKPLSNGNVIYNSSFDQGNRHIGYWRTTDGTVLEVPRYTTEALTDDDVKVVDVASKTNYEKIADGVKYYERRAQISAESGVAPTIYQSGFALPKGDYTLSMDVYSEKDTRVIANIEYYGDDLEVPEVLSLSVNTVQKGYTEYKAEDGLKTLTWNFTVDKDVEDATLYLAFDRDASVQIDNVTLIGAQLGEQVDSTPLTTEDNWTADNGAGTALELAKEGDVYSITAISGGTWYSPQIISDNYTLIAGKQYKFETDYKLEGTSNNTLQYFIQENQGSWHGYAGGPTTITYDPDKADADGFNHYETTFTADLSLNTVHTVFGLGNSEATGDGVTFSFKNTKITLVENEDPDDPTPGDEWKELEETQKADLYNEVQKVKYRNLENYTDSSIKALAETIKTAEDVLNDRYATQEDVDAALKALQDAETSLKLKVEVVFDDINAGQWWVPFIQYAYDNAIMKGKGDNFGPADSITREEFVQVLYNISGKPELTGTAKEFKDVDKEAWYAKAVLWANENKIANGVGTGGEKFGVSQKITRQDLALMLYRYASVEKYNLDVTDGQIDKFADSAKVATYAKEALNWAITQGIMVGKGDNLDPTGNATRAECATMMMHLLEANK